MKIAFMGTPEVSAYVLEQIHKEGHNVLWALTQPDRPSGRGKALKPPAVKTKAKELGIRVLQAEKFDKKLFEEINKLEKPDIAIIVAYGVYIPSYFLEYPKYRCLNIHFSLLPKYRGSSPVARAIMDNQKKTGITIMLISREMDAGDILSQKELLIKEDDTTESLTKKLGIEGTSLLLETIPKYINGEINTISQDAMSIQASYAEKISSSEKYINWNESAVSINNKIRALYPWPCAESKISGMVLKFIQSRVKDHLDINIEEFTNGTVVNIDKKQGFIEVKTASGSVLLEKVQVSGKKVMLVSEFLNGYKIEKGMRFE
jgi:methionyl-tRNA formyltransferase